MGNWVWPLPGHSGISSQFGPRICPFHGSETHTGIDIPAPYGTKIIAARAGRVEQAGGCGGYGNLVIVDHGGGFKTRYAHCSGFLVKAGAQVSAGQPIAKVGSTGNSTGNHLHFEVRDNGVAKNPVAYVSGSDSLARFSGDKGASSPAKAAGSASPASGSRAAKGAKKDVTTVKVRSVTGKTGNQDSGLRNKKAIQKKGAEILIQNGSSVFQPELEGEATLEYEREGTPGKLTFTAYKDAAL